MNSEKQELEHNLAELEKLVTNRSDAIALINKILYTDVAQTHEPIDRFDAISRNELALLIGYLLKNKSLSKSISPLGSDYSKVIMKLRRLLKSIHLHLVDNGHFDNIHSVDNFFTRKSLIEVTFYEEPGYYNDQPIILANYLYNKNRDWIIKKKGFKIEHLADFYLLLCTYLQKKYHDYSEKQIQSNVALIFFTKDDIWETSQSVFNSENPMSRSTIQNIIDSFSCRPGEQPNSFFRPGDENILSYYPIIEIKPKTYWLPIPDMLSIASYLSPLHWMREDGSYKDFATNRLGEDFEVLCGDMLRRSFKKVYTSLKISKGKHDVTDIDDLAIIDDTAIIIQAKNKRMMPDTFAGNIESLKRDFNIAIQQAYDQGEKSAIALLNQANYRFRDSNNKSVSLPHLNNVFILCISSSVYYAGAIQIKEFLKQHHTNLKPPIIFSIFDLDLLTRYLTNPYELIYFLEKRIERYDDIACTNEAVPLSIYLFSDLLQNTNIGTTLYADDIIAELDEDYRNNQWMRKPERRESFSIRYKNAPNFVKLLETVYGIDHPKKDIIFRKLLSLPTSAATQLSEKIAQHNLSVISSANCGFSGVFGELGVSYFVGDTRSIHTLLRKATNNAKIYGAKSWIGFIKTNKENSADCFYIEGGQNCKLP